MLGKLLKEKVSPILKRRDLLKKVYTRMFSETKIPQK